MKAWECMGRVLINFRVLSQMEYISKVHLSKSADLTSQWSSCVFKDRYRTTIPTSAQKPLLVDTMVSPRYRRILTTGFYPWWGVSVSSTHFCAPPHHLIVRVLLRSILLPFMPSDNNRAVRGPSSIIFLILLQNQRGKQEAIWIMDEGRIL